ncbi:MAG TPA: DUF1887 family CARF protein [Ktedonobacteraceae bacterium]|nr:DUF1887 family CARF protein [Ktedonobacteraceae bacterium]
MTLMVALVGDQTLPNFLPIRHYKPDNVLLVYTTRTESKYKQLKSALQQETTIFGLDLKSNSHETEAITKTLKDMFETEELASQKAEFNLTGGTKPMSLAAYQIAQQYEAPVFYLESEGKHSRVYHYTWENQQLKAASNELLPECATLKDLFNLHFGIGNWQETGVGRKEGSPFEAALANALQAHGYEVMIGVNAMGQIDIDVAMRYENQFGIIEAKMGKNGSKLDGIKQLNNVLRHLGTYTQPFYAINGKWCASVA